MKYMMKNLRIEKIKYIYLKKNFKLCLKNLYYMNKYIFLFNYEEPRLFCKKWMIAH